MAVVQGLHMNARFTALMRSLELRLHPGCLKWKLSDYHLQLSYSSGKNACNIQQEWTGEASRMLHMKPLLLIKERRTVCFFIV